ncbi:MAG: aspartyl protease family protein [Pyrinomonadaceae bacterium]
MRVRHRVAVGVLAAFVVWAGSAADGGARPATGAGVAAPASSQKSKNLQRAERALREGEFEQAEKMFRELLAKNPKDHAARLGLSFALLKQRKIQDAFDAAARVLSLDPMSPRAHALLGASLLASGDFRLSVEEFRTALSFKDNEAMAIAGLAMVDFYENRTADSLAGLRRAAFIDPEEPDYHFNLGQVAARFERYAEAADAYEDFLRIAPRTDAERRARIRGLIDFLRYLGTQRSLLRTGGPERVRVPIEVVNNRPVVQVRINGSKEVMRFVIDTGAGMCVVSTQSAKRLGLRPVARGGLARAVGGGGKFEIVYGFLNSLHLGEARVDNVPVYIRDFFNDQEPVDGYVGLSVVSKYLALIDYSTREMTMMRDGGRPSPEEEAARPAGVDVPIRSTSSGFWSGEIGLDGIERPLNFIIDTGASITVVSEDLAEREGMGRFTQANRLKVYGAAGVAENVPVLLLPRVTVGSHVRRNVSAAVLDLDSVNETSGFEQTGILGGNILRFFRVSFDFGRGVVRMEMIPGYVPPVTTPREATITPQGY